MCIALLPPESKFRFKSTLTHSFMYELLGFEFFSKIPAEWLFIGDGGHYENLGIIPLLRRHANEIFCFDSGYDSMDTCGDMLFVLDYCRKNLGMNFYVCAEDQDDFKSERSTKNLKKKSPENALLKWHQQWYQWRCARKLENTNKICGTWNNFTNIKSFVTKKNQHCSNCRNPRLDNFEIRSKPNPTSTSGNYFTEDFDLPMTMVIHVTYKNGEEGIIYYTKLRGAETQSAHPGGWPFGYLPWSKTFTNQFYRKQDFAFLATYGMRATLEVVKKIKQKIKRTEDDNEFHKKFVNHYNEMKNGKKEIETKKK